MSRHSLRDLPAGGRNTGSFRDSGLQRGFSVASRPTPAIEAEPRKSASILLRDANKYGAPAFGLKPL